MSVGSVFDFAVHEDAAYLAVVVEVAGGGDRFDGVVEVRSWL